MADTTEVGAWVPNIGKMICHPDDRVILRFANGETSDATRAGDWHWGMHRVMPGTILAWQHAGRS